MSTSRALPRTSHRLGDDCGPATTAPMRSWAIAVHDGIQTLAELFQDPATASALVIPAPQGAFGAAIPPLDQSFVPGAGESAGIDPFTIDGGFLVRTLLSPSAVSQLAATCGRSGSLTSLGLALTSGSTVPAPRAVAAALAPGEGIVCSAFTLDPDEQGLLADVLYLHLTGSLDSIPDGVSYGLSVNIDQDGRSRTDIKPAKGFPRDWLSCGDHTLSANRDLDTAGITYMHLRRFKTRRVEAMYLFFPDAIAVIVLHPASHARYLPLLEMARNGGQTSADLGTVSWGYAANDGGDPSCRMPYARVTPVAVGAAAP